MALNEYDELLQTGKPAAGNEYDALIAEQRQGEVTLLKQSLYAASQTDPDRRARALQLAERTKLPADLVERNLDLVERTERFENRDYDAILERSPKVAEWFMESPDNAAVAADDLDNLSTFEALTRAVTTGFRHGRQTTELGRLGFRLADGDRDPALVARVEELERSLAATPGGRGFSAQWVYPAAKLIGQMLESGAKALEGGFAGASAGAAAAAIAGQVGPQVALPEEIVTVPAAAGAGFIAGLGAGFWADVYQVEAGHAYLELARVRGTQGEEIPEETRRAAAVGVGLINAALETTGVALVTAPFKAAAKKFVTEGTREAIVKPTVARAAANFARAYATAIAGEVTTEVLQESTNILAEEVAKLVSEGNFEQLLNDPEQRDAAIERLFNIASETFRGMALVGLPGATVNLAADVRNIQRARENQRFFEALGETAQTSKLRARLPQKLQEALDRITRDGPVENIYVPIEQFATYFQTVGLDPRQVAAEVLGSPQVYDQALATGEDLKIPTARYAASLAASEHHAALVPHLKLHPDEMTAAEADAFIESLKREAEAQTPEQVQEGARSVREDVLGQLLGLGYERSTAEAYAELYESTFRTLGQRAGVDPFALYSRYGLKIERPTPEVLRQAGETEALDIMIDRLRRGDLPTDREVYGPSLVDFLVERGGLRDQGGELAARDARLARRGLVRDTGLALDHAAEIAVEAGYLAERDPNRLLEAIDAELRGQPVFAPSRVNARLLDIRGALEELDAELQRLGIDVRLMDNERIKRALRTGEPPGNVVQELAQRVREFFQLAPSSEPAIAETLEQFLDRRAAERRRLVKEAGLVVGMRTKEGEIIAGEPGQQHFHLLQQYPRESLEAEFGFVDKDGRFYTRGEAATAFKVYDAVQLNGEQDDQVLFQGTIPPVTPERGPGEEGLSRTAPPEPDWAEEFRDVGGTIDPDGTVLVWHATTRENAEAILREGIFRRPADATDDYGVFFAGGRDAQSAARDYGDGTIIPVRVRAVDLRPDDLFPGRRMDFSVRTRRGIYRPVAVGEAAFRSDSGELTPGARSGAPTEFAQDDLAPRVIQRGAIRIGADRQISIRLLKRADLSTFLHETGHFYLEVLGDLAEKTDVPEALKRDYQTILDWFGVASRAEITTEHHERWARAFEAYLMEGKAPSAALRSAFAKFRAWLVAIYRTISRLDVALTPEVRSVMERLLATEEEIAAAEREAEVVPIFTTAADAGMTETEFAAYQRTVEEASLAAREQMQRRLLEEHQRAQKQWYREARAAIRDEVAREVDQQPDQLAAALLTRGTLPDGSALPEGQRPFKLDRQAVADVYGADVARRLRRMLTRENGVHPDQAAEALGYRTGEELIVAMLNVRPRRELIEAEADARLRERYGDILLDGTALQAAARQAVESEARAKVIAAELAALRRKAREVRPFVRAREEAIRERQREGLSVLRSPELPIGRIREMAEGMIAQQRVRDVNPNTYLIAIRRAARQAVEAAARGEYQVAAAAKQRELLNLELYRAAVAAREEADEIASYMTRFSKTATRERIGKAGADYLEQIDALLDRFEFKRVSGTELARRESLAEWIRKKEASGETLGEEIDITPHLVDETRRQNYRDLTVEELRGLRDAVRQIEHFARLKNRLLAAKLARDREEARAELINAIEANLKDKGPPPISKAGLSRVQRLGQAASAFDASLIKMEQLIDWLDGGDLDGPWHRYLWNGAADAQTAELDYSAKITQRVTRAVMNIPPAIRRRMRERVTIAGIDRVMTRKDLIGVALNVGNDSNYQKLLKGMGWTEEQVEQMLSRLTKEEWDFVQEIWDTLESLWPEIARLQKELTGLEPEKIAPRPVPTRFGIYRGGYYPVIYDPLASEQGELQLASRVGDLVESTYTRATTPKGHTKARIEQFARPFDLDIDNLPGHIAGVIKDLTHRKWLLDANWIVHDREIRAAIRRHLGDEYVRLFGDWVRQVVNDRNFASLRSLGIWRRTIEQLRYNVMIAAIGFSAATMGAQIAGLGPAIDVIGEKGARYFARGFGQFIRRPRATYEFVTELSGEMRHRLETRDRDLRDKLRLLAGREDFMAKIQDLAMRSIVWAEMVVSLPAWLGAYQKALDEGASQEVAIRAGDRAVRLSQGAAGAKDLAAVMARNDLFMRTITMFYTPFSALYARLRDIGHSVHGIRDVPQAAFRLWWVWLVPAVIGELLAGRGPDEDDEGEWWLRTVLLYPTLAVPFFRDVAGGAFGEFGYQLSPIAQVGESVARTVSKARGVAAGDAAVEELVKPALRTTGYLLGVPARQIEITGGYLYDVALGEEPEDLGEFARNIFYRRRE